MDNSEFEEQLMLEAKEKAKAQELQDPNTYVDPNDGTVYEWDHQKQAWFPKISEDFLASYQANYGNFEGSEASSQKEKEAAVDAAEQTPKQALKPGEKRKAQEPAWFDVDDTHNTKVYVTGLPLDITDEEFAELMGKCGLVMKEPSNNKLKLKLYKNPDGTLKGDGLCCYIRIESVELALKILDGYRMKNGEIHVERAKFQMKGDYDPSKKPRKKKGKEKEKLKRKIEKLFDWRPDKLRGERSRNEKTVIIKNMFDPKEFETDPRVILEYQQDIREECTKCGEVKKVVVYDRHQDGVVSVTFKEPEEADECINLMNRRWFAGRQLSAETWDGKTRYKIQESEAELEKRISQWDKFLEEGDDTEKSSTVAGTSTLPSSSAHVNQNPQLTTEQAAPHLAEVSDEMCKTNVESESLKADAGKEKNCGDNPKTRKKSDYDGACLTDEERHSDQDSPSSDTEEKSWP